MSNAPTLSSDKESGLGPPSQRGAPRLSVSVRRGVLWSALSTLLLRLFNVAVTAVVAHILAPRDFGVFTVALTAYTVISSLSEFGIGSCLIRADLDIDAMAPTMVTVSLMTSAVSGEVMALFARQIATALGSADGAESIRIMALAVLISGISSVPGAQLARDFKQDKLFLANIISLIPSTAVLILLAKSGNGAMAFAWSRLIASFVMCCVMVVSVPKHYRPGISRNALSILFRFGLPLAGANIINFILINVDYVFVGHLMGAVALGAYMLAFTLASSPGLLLGNVINSIAMPAFSRVKNDPDRLKNAMIGSLRAVSLILMPMCSLMWALARPLVLTLYGAKWEASVPVLSILSIYGGISIICILFANMLTSLGKAKFTLVVQVLWLCALVPAMVLGVHRNGIVGAAAAHIVVIVPLVLPSYLIALKRATGIRLTMLGRAVLPPLLAASAAALAARITAAQFASPLAQLVSGLTVGCLIYLAAAGPLLVAWLSHTQAARLRAPRLFRLYDSAARVVGRPVSRRWDHDSDGDRHRGQSAGIIAQRGPATATFTLPPAGQGAGVDHGQDVVVPGSIVALLRPEARIVPFWPRRELGELLEWCRAPRQTRVRLVTGESGTGKTRLALEFARELEYDGWQALWVPLGSEPEAARAARRIARPTVLLVDNAETRTGLLPLLSDAVDSLNGRDLRVLLLACNAGEWWHHLVDGVGYRLGEKIAAAQPIRLGPMAHGPGQHVVFDAAVTAFAARFGVIRPAVQSLLSDPDAPVLVAHAAALSAVLDHAEWDLGEHPRSNAEVLETLLRRETRYWARAAAARGLDLDPDAQRRAIAVACLIGADSESAAAELLRRLPDFAGSAELCSQVARWLHDLDPGQATVGRMVTGWLGSLQPDRVAEHLIIGELARQPDLIPAVFTGLDESHAKKALTVLGRAALNYPGAASLLVRALAADLEHLAVPALAVAVETNPSIDRMVADAVTRTVVPVQVLERIAVAIPRRSLAVSAAVTVLNRLAAEATDGGSDRVPFAR